MKSALARKFEEIKASLHPWKPDVSPAVRPPFYLQEGFFANADTLWSQFAQNMADAVELNDGLTTLLFAFRRDAYEFLTAAAERIFSQEILNELMEALRSWSKETIGSTHITMPQVRVYVEGCQRELLCDRTEAHWHYMLSLTRNEIRDAGRIKLVAESISGPRNGAAGMASLVNLQLRFNHLLVHDTQRAYQIASARTGKDPSEGSVFLDGYMW